MPFRRRGPFWREAAVSPPPPPRRSAYARPLTAYTPPPRPGWMPPPPSPPAPPPDPVSLPAPPTGPEQRAMWLLMRYLTEKQRQEFELFEYFHVEGSDGRTYRIRFGSIANVDLLSPSGRFVEGRLCCVVHDNVPTGDHMLAQLLAIQTDAKSFRETARWYPPENEVLDTRTTFALRWME